MDYAFIVGVAEEERDIAEMAAAKFNQAPGQVY